MNRLMSTAWLTIFWVSLSTQALSATVEWRKRASDEVAVTSADIAAEIAYGREIAARILGRYKANESPALTKYVNLVGLTLAKNSNRPELEYHFAILDTDEVNAYAAPGGYIFITRGALGLMKDEAELAGVLAHEIGHVTEKHVVKELKIKGEDDSAVSGLAQLVGGSSESAKAAFSQAVDKGLEIIFADGYKREDEMQADRDSVLVSTISGYDSAALARYLDRIRPLKESPTTPDDSHPTFSSRISQINEIIATEGLQSLTGARNQKRFATAMKNLN